jgi:uncharacterized protein YuzE
MKIEYDPVHDLLNPEFLVGVEVEESLEIDGVILDYAKDRRLVAIGILDASKRTTQEPLQRLDVSIVRGVATSSGADSSRPALDNPDRVADKSSTQIRRVPQGAPGPLAGRGCQSPR